MSPDPTGEPTLYEAPLRRVSLPLTSIHNEESLASIVYRTAFQSELKVCNIYLSAGYRRGMVPNAAVNELHLAPNLAEVLRQPEALIRARTYPEVSVGASGRAYVDFGGASVPLAMLNARYRRLAPMALDERPFHTVLSEHVLLPFDPLTATMSIDTCPHCNRRLTWAKATHVHLCTCGNDLRSAKPVFVPPELTEKATFVSNLLDPCPDIHGQIVSQLPIALQHLDRGHVFEIGCQAVRALWQTYAGKANNWPDIDKIRLLDRAATLLVGWPDSVDDALSKLPNREARCRSITALVTLSNSPVYPTEVSAKLKELCPDQKVTSTLVAMRPPPRAPRTVQRCVNERVARTLSSTLAKPSQGALATSVTLSAAARIFGRKLSTTAKILRKITPIELEQAPRRRTHWRRSEVLRVAAVLNSSPTLYEACQTLRLPRYAIDQMLALDLLRHPHDDALGVQETRELVDPESIAHLREQLIRQSSSTGGEGWIRLIDAMSAIGGRPKPWGPALTMMLHDRSLPYHAPVGADSPSINIPNFLVPPSAQDVLRVAHFDRTAYPHVAFETVVTCWDAAEILNLANGRRGSIHAEMIAAGALNKGPMTLDKVASVGAEWITNREIAVRTGRPWGEWSRKLASIGLTRSFFGWPRRPVEPFLTTTT